MSYNENGTYNDTKSAKLPIRGCSMVTVICPWLRVLDLKGTRSLLTPGLCQPWYSPEPQASYRSTMPLQVQSHVTSLALGICRSFLGFDNLGFGEDRGWQRPRVESERVSLSSNTLSRDIRCTCCTTEHLRMGDFAFFVYSMFIVIHCLCPILFTSHKTLVPFKTFCILISHSSKEMFI